VLCLRCTPYCSRAPWRADARANEQGNLTSRVEAAQRLCLKSQIQALQEGWNMSNRSICFSHFVKVCHPRVSHSDVPLSHSLAERIVDPKAT
jgi:hypothetical protein